jgi:hypothetical protein
MHKKYPSEEKEDCYAQKHSQKKKELCETPQQNSPQVLLVQNEIHIHACINEKKA